MTECDSRGPRGCGRCVVIDPHLQSGQDCSSVHFRAVNFGTRLRVVGYRVEVFAEKDARTTRSFARFLT